jgi:hypothetical protein
MMDLPSLNFKPGIGVQATIRHRLDEPLNFFPSRGFLEFFLVASVGRCKYRLCEISIGLIPQATLGGSTTDFRPRKISDRVFKVVVASRNVSFHIYNLKSFACDQYKKNSTSGVVEAQIGSQNAGNSCLKKIVNGQWFIIANIL